jgi:capsular exopolysaccharide synthesis family protein
MFAAWLVIPVTYTATAWLRIADREPRLLFDTKKADSLLDARQAQATLISSNFVLNAALRKPGIAQLHSLGSTEDQVAWLRKHLEISFPGRAEIMQIAISGENPQELEKLVNAVTAAYMDEVVTVDRENLVRRKQTLQRSYDENKRKVERQSYLYNELANQLQTADSEIARQKELHALQSLTDLRTQVNHLRGQIQGLEQKEAILKSRMASLRPEGAAQPPSQEDTIERLAEVALRQDPSMVQILERLQALEQAKTDQSLVARAGEKSRAVQRIQDQIDSLNAEKTKRTEELMPQMRELVKGQMAQGMALAPPTETERIQTWLETAQLERAVLAEELKAAQEDFNKAAKEAEKLGSCSTELEQRRAELERLKKLTDQIGTELQQWEIELTADSDRVTVLEQASLQKSSSGGKRRLQILMIGMAVFGLAVLGVVGLDFLTHPVSSAEEVSHELGVSVIGSLPLVARRPSYVVRGGNGEAIRRLYGLTVESVDNIRTNLLHRADTEGIRTVLITSALEKEGKTTVSCQLATSLARSGRRTLLIDGDLRRPAAHRVFDLPMDPGMAELLRGEVQLDEVIRPTRAAGLWLIPAGATSPEAIQALAQARLQPIFERLRDEFDFVLIDSGPVLTDSDAVLFAQFADGVLLSVLKDVSRVPRVSEACERLRAVDLKVLGAVINGMSVGRYRPYGRPRTIEVESTPV